LTFSSHPLHDVFGAYAPEAYLCMVIVYFSEGLDGLEICNVRRSLRSYSRYRKSKMND
jgi:hypothetical protein